MSGNLVSGNLVNSSNARAREADLADLAHLTTNSHQPHRHRSHRDIVEELGVAGYPVFKWWKKGATEAEPFYYVHYSGRHGHTLMRMVNDRLGRDHHEEL